MPSSARARALAALRWTVRLLSPGRNLWLSAVRTGLAGFGAALVLGFVVLLPAALLLGAPPIYERSSDPKFWDSVVGAPIFETLILALLYVSLDSLSPPGWVAPVLIGLLAVMVHPQRGVMMLLPFTGFVLMTCQYALHHDQRGHAAAIAAVTVTHATHNGCAVLLLTLFNAIPDGA